MKNPKSMTYKEMEIEVTENRRKMRSADNKMMRELINRNHELMVEMDSRWN